MRVITRMPQPACGAAVSLEHGGTSARSASAHPRPRGPIERWDIAADRLGPDQQRILAQGRDGRRARPRARSRRLDRGERRAEFVRRGSHHARASSAPARGRARPGSRPGHLGTSRKSRRSPAGHRRREQDAGHERGPGAERTGDRQQGRAARLIRAERRMDENQPGQDRAAQWPRRDRRPQEQTGALIVTGAIIISANGLLSPPVSSRSEPS